jgi:hypothetical protein
MGSRKNITKRRNKKIKGGLFFGLMGNDNKPTASPGDTSAIESKMKAEKKVSKPAANPPTTPTTSITSSTTPTPTPSPTPAPSPDPSPDPSPKSSITLPKERSWVNFLTFGIVGGKRRTLRKRKSRRQTR